MPCLAIAAGSNDVTQSTVLDCYEGRLIKTTGDGALAEFASPLAAVRCAVEIQDHLASGSSPLRLRVIASEHAARISEKVYSEVETGLPKSL
jgi:class 3 adenylate cyclase